MDCLLHSFSQSTDLGTFKRPPGNAIIDPGNTIHPWSEPLTKEMPVGFEVLSDNTLCTRSNILA